MQAEVLWIQSNDHVDWSEFAQYQSPDAYDDYGWFHVTVGVSGEEGGDDFQVCVATPRAAGRAKAAGSIPGILVDHFDCEAVRDAICHRVAAVNGDTWMQMVDQLRTFMRWEYE